MPLILHKHVHISIIKFGIEMYTIIVISKIINKMYL